jgi:hypothetical protein
MKSIASSVSESACEILLEQVRQLTLKLAASDSANKVLQVENNVLEKAEHSRGNTKHILEATYYIDICELQDQKLSDTYVSCNNTRTTY